MQPQSRRPVGQPVRSRSYTSGPALAPRPLVSQPLPPRLAQPVVTSSAASRPISPVKIARNQRFRSAFSFSPRLASVALIIIGVAVIGGLGYYRAASQPALPSTVAQQLSFGVYFPKAKTTVATIDKGTIRYQASGGLFSYTARLADGTTVSVNQQATPISFVDIPQAYDKLVSSLQPYTSFESINGKVSLTYPKELKGGQSAVMNAKGTLLFARPSKSLSDDQWRQLFNGLFADQIAAAK